MVGARPGGEAKPAEGARHGEQQPRRRGLGSELLAPEQARADEFRAAWLRLAPARQFAAMLVGYRADGDLSQRALAELLGVSQPRIARMESGEQNSDVETISSVVGKLGTEFALAGATHVLGAHSGPTEGPHRQGGGRLAPTRQQA